MSSVAGRQRSWKLGMVGERRLEKWVRWTSLRLLHFRRAGNTIDQQSYEGMRTCEGARWDACEKC